MLEMGMHSDIVAVEPMSFGDVRTFAGIEHPFLDRLSP